MEALQDQCYLSKAYPIMKHMWIAFLLDAVFLCVCVCCVYMCDQDVCLSAERDY